MYMIDIINYRWKKGDSAGDGDGEAMNKSNKLMINNWESNLCINIELVQNDHEKAYIINLSDQNDPLFLFTCTVPQGQYSRVQDENDLIVDFEGFPDEIKNIVQS